ncbi:MAG TPA: hypothetical protein VJN70_05395 [Gemmatimonadaceae bacterium]|nr:hypothetical protein [Gemmatimonadaceae bacterium]
MRFPHVALIFLALHTASAQDAAQQEFIIRKGKDTVAVERFTRDAGILNGQLTQSNGAKIEYVANLRPDHSVEHIEFSRQGLQGPAVTLSVDFGDTLINASFEAQGKKQQMTVATQARPMPFLVASFAILEQIALASHPAEGQKVKWIAARLGAGDTASISVTRGLADTVVISAPNGDVKLATSKAGDVIGAWFAPAQWVVERKGARVTP